MADRLEEAIDIQERHWRLHWMLNLAQKEERTDPNRIATLIGRSS